MIEAIEVAIHEGKILCAFPTRGQCKEFVRENYKEVDPFDVIIETQYLSKSAPYSGPVPR